jgi:nicotinate-nucleotide adenylyltransferase
MKRIAFYGGSFDPIHRGHLAIARRLLELFTLEELVFIPAFHAPHKKLKKPTSAFHRYTMICLETKDDPQVKVSRIELEAPEKPYTIDTLTRLKDELKDAQIFFVMGTDSWAEITTWREWEKVLTLVNIIVVTRPDYEIGFSHIPEEIRERIIDLRNSGQLSVVSCQLEDKTSNEQRTTNDEPTIFITDAVQIDVSATEIRQKIKENADGWREDVPEEVAKYIEKYELYK